MALQRWAVEDVPTGRWIIRASEWFKRCVDSPHPKLFVRRADAERVRDESNKLRRNENARVVAFDIVRREVSP